MARRRVGGCVFCGQTGVPLYKEDVIPKWVRSVLKFTGPVKVTKNRTGEVIRTDETIVLTVRGAVCRACNNEWLSGLENRVKPLISDAIQGRITAFSAGDMQTIPAVWAVKTALLIELALKEARGDGFAPASHFRWLFDHRDDPCPPPGSQVWIAGLDMGGSLVSWNFAGGVFTDELEPPDAYLAHFSVGCLVFTVFGQDFGLLAGTGRQLMRCTPPPRFRYHLLGIWPNFHPVRAWPGAHQFKRSDLTDFCDWRDARFETPTPRRVLSAHPVAIVRFD